MTREEAVERIYRDIPMARRSTIEHMLEAIEKAGGRVQFPCEVCKGSGMIRTEFPRQRCKSCSGFGWVTVTNG